MIFQILCVALPFLSATFSLYFQTKKKKYTKISRKTLPYKRKVFDILFAEHTWPLFTLFVWIDFDFRFKFNDPLLLDRVDWPASKLSSDDFDSFETSVFADRSLFDDVGLSLSLVFVFERVLCFPPNWLNENIRIKCWRVQWVFNYFNWIIYLRGFFGDFFDCFFTLPIFQNNIISILTHKQSIRCIYLFI